ncbi:MAG TPA: enoyl-ACP reductase FabI [Isosphaeraceae bacterium]|nr:enoyl-ACP reductase FabI [Isosphaeraceae bacterium]
MADEIARPLSGLKALVIGIANDQSIAYGCARAFRRQGAELAITYLNDKARPFVEPLARELEAPIFLPVNVQQEGQLEAVFEEIRETWGRLDIALHSIAFAPKEDLQGRLLDCSLSGFLTAIDVSCHSFLRMSRLAAPLMTEGGTLLAMTFQGSTEVVLNYDVMGPVKAALESAVRYLAAELGPRRIRVHAISPGPVATRASSGLKEFDRLIADSRARSPLGELVEIDDVGAAAAFLASPRARRMTGTILHVDAGLHITG